LRRAPSALVVGSDGSVCLYQVCPWNKFSWQGGGSPLYGSPAAEVTNPKLLELLRLDSAAFDRRFAASPIKSAASPLPPRQSGLLEPVVCAYLPTSLGTIWE